MHHFRSSRQAYSKYRAADNQHGDCAFCYEGNVQSKTLIKSDTMCLIKNRTQYDVFEGRRVLDHLMVIPIRHVETLAGFTDQEKLDMMTIIGEYEERGYNVYARGVGSVSRSVPHQHTHLIKLVEKRSKYYVHIQKPYIVLNK